jgi:hypothetical protein
MKPELQVQVKLPLALTQVPFEHSEVFFSNWHWAEQAVEEPPRTSLVQPLLSLQLVGQAPSHFSDPSTTPFPQAALQSLSVVASSPIKQQPSPPLRAFLVLVHLASQVPGAPVSFSSVQGSLSSHFVGQSLPSQLSAPSLTPLPHFAWQEVWSRVVDQKSDQAATFV